MPHRFAEPPEEPDDPISDDLRPDCVGPLACTAFFIAVPKAGSL